MLTIIIQYFVQNGILAYILIVVSQWNFVGICNLDDNTILISWSLFDDKAKKKHVFYYIFLKLHDQLSLPSISFSPVNSLLTLSILPFSLLATHIAFSLQTLFLIRTLFTIFLNPSVFLFQSFHRSTLQVFFF